MVFSLRNWIRSFLFILLFILFTVTVFLLLRTVAGWLSVPDPYAEPKGYAVKAFGQVPDEQADATFAERLRWFYVIGE